MVAVFSSAQLLQAEYDQRPNILFVLLFTRTLFWERTIYFTTGGESNGEGGAGERRRRH